MGLRSASTVSISNDSSKAVFRINEETKNESFKDILDIKDPDSNKISARFSVDKEETKSIYRKNSQSRLKSTDRSVSPPPMPIEAVVQVRLI